MLFCFGLGLGFGLGGSLALGIPGRRLLRRSASASFASFSAASFASFSIAAADRGGWMDGACEYVVVVCCFLLYRCRWKERVGIGIRCARGPVRAGFRLVERGEARQDFVDPTCSFGTLDLHLCRRLRLPPLLKSQHRDRRQDLMVARATLHCSAWQVRRGLREGKMERGEGWMLW